MSTVLVVDEDLDFRYAVTNALSSLEITVVTATTACEVIEAVGRGRPDVVVLSAPISDQSNLEVHARIRQINPRLPVIIITSNGTPDMAIEATKAGVFEYVLRPINLDYLREVVSRAVALSRTSHIPTVLAEEANDVGDRLVGNCPAMQAVYKAIGRVARQDVAVLIHGENGTGEELKLVARSIHEHSLRSQNMFLTVNCTVPCDSRLESELFGHERAAFVGAGQRRIGKFEQATGGTVFLDEVGSMGPVTQAKLLRLLQEKKFERLGGDTSIHADVRVIAATNQDLDKLVSARCFRADLFYLLCVFPILVPPLRHRLTDMPLLLGHCFRRTGNELNKHVHGVSSEVMRVMERYPWPGNIGELQSTVKLALLHATSDVITLDCLPPNLRSAGVGAQKVDHDRFDLESYVRELLVGGQADLYRHVQTQNDRLILTSVLRHTEGNQVEAARLLGMSRNTLRAKIRCLRLSVES